MCLITNQQKPIILNEDMIVYKLLKDTANCIESVFEKYQWNINTLHKTRIKKVQINKRTIDSFAYFDNIALDSLFKAVDVNNLVALLNILENKIYIYNVISKGFHSFVSKTRVPQSATRHSLYECTIPAGSQIYKDHSGLVVSNQLIINKKIF